MIKDIIDINGYWRVIVYFDIDYNSFDIIDDELDKFSTPLKERAAIFASLSTNAKAFTISFPKYKTSIVGFNKHNSYFDYLNSIIHESEHIKQSILYTYNVPDKGENPAYTVGYIAMRLIKSFIS